MPNIRYHYYYGDGSNCKREGSVVFGNKRHWPAEQLTTVEILKDRQFIARQVQLPELFHWRTTPHFDPNRNDHCWHTYSHVTDTDDPPTDPRDISDFLLQLAFTPWQDYDVVADYEPERIQRQLMSAVKNILLNMCDRDEVVDEGDEYPCHEFAYLYVAYAEAGGNLRQDGDTEDWPAWTKELLEECKMSLGSIDPNEDITTPQRGTVTYPKKGE